MSHLENSQRSVLQKAAPLAAAGRRLLAIMQPGDFGGGRAVLQ